MSDTIYREDAIKAIEELRKEPYWMHDGDDYRVCGLSEAEDAIEHLPSADRPQGEWIDAEIPLESGGSMPIQVCNLCKTFYPLAYTGGGHRFCPNCGASMREREGE